MSNILYLFIVEVTGAFVSWMFLGFRGKFSDQITVRHEQSKKSTRNFFASIAFWAVVYLALNFLIRRRSH